MNTTNSRLYRKAVLANKMTVVWEGHRQVRSVSIGLWVRVGSADEPRALNGISHFVEHMVFKGTRTRDHLEIATYLESVGGELNAFTDRQNTCYHATCLAEHLDRAVEILADLVTGATFPTVQLERERKVLVQELAMTLDSPEDLANDLFFKSAWGRSAIGQPVIGRKSVLHGIGRRDLVRFFNTHYRPENMVLAVAGNCDFETVVKLARRYFKFEAQPSVKIQPVEPLRSYKPGYRFSKAVTNQVYLLVGYNAFGFSDDYRIDASVLSFILGGGMSSRLFQQIRERAALAYSVDCDFTPLSEIGVFLISLATSNKHLPACINILRRELRAITEREVGRAELDLAKNQLKGGVLLATEQMEVRQESIGRNQLMLGRYVSVDQVLKDVDRVTPDRIRQLAGRLFQKGNESIVVVGKTKPKAARLAIL